MTTTSQRHLRTDWMISDFALYINLLLAVLGCAHISANFLK